MYGTLHKVCRSLICALRMPDVVTCARTANVQLSCSSSPGRTE